ncbi:hypothetical protein ACFQRD_03085 [Brachybacterium sp. GCM10030268]
MPPGPRRLRSAQAALRKELRRTNFAGRAVSLAEGVLVVAGTSALALRSRRRSDAAVLAGIGALGLADDLLEPRLRRAGRTVSKGLRGHLGALREGQLTTGAAKALGIPVLAMAGAAAAPRPRSAVMTAIDGALVAGCANLANLLDLRPGRALKAVLPAAALLAARPARAGTEGEAGRALALAALVPGLLVLPADVREHGMLGDAGANVLGAAVGTAATRILPEPARAVLLVAVVALTLASEKVSFSAVIESTPALRAVDRLGRRSAMPSAPAAPRGADDEPDAEEKAR